MVYDACFVSLTITYLSCICLKGSVIAIVKMKEFWLQRATLGAGLQNRTPTTSGARSWYAMSEVENKERKELLVSVHERSEV
jgi:hypothetical protein